MELRLKYDFINAPIPDTYEAVQFVVRMAEQFAAHSNLVTLTLVDDLKLVTERALPPQDRMRSLEFLCKMNDAYLYMA